jgi:two-component system sensor histidine kinase DesK
VAERERIGRDLHDLLGHTLSLIAIKAELAEKLSRRDAESAAREIADVKNIAREALKEVRVAVSGIRAAALEGEIAAARALLGSSGVELTAARLDEPLPTEVESGVAMIVREAVTNIHRHSGARHAVIEIQKDADCVLLVVRDDGKGGITRRGNGLVGIGERVRSLAGTLDIESLPGKGTVVSARLPLPARS